MKTVLLLVICCMFQGTLIFAQEGSQKIVPAADEFSRLHFALLFGTGEGSNGNVNSALNSALGSHESEGNISKLVFRGEYYIQKKWGLGFQFNSGTQEANATLYKGSEYVPGFWFILYFPGYTITYNDAIHVSVTSNEYTLFAAYKLVDYKKRVSPLEIIARGGFSVLSLKEHVNMTVVDRVGTSDSFVSETAEYNSSETGVNFVANVSFQLHLSRRVSLYLADFTQRLALYNPEFEAVSISSDIKTLTLGKHKIPTAGFSYGAGIAINL